MGRKGGRVGGKEYGGEGEGGEEVKTEQDKTQEKKEGEEQTRESGQRDKMKRNISFLAWILVHKENGNERTRCFPGPASEAYWSFLDHSSPPPGLDSGFYVSCSWESLGSGRARTFSRMEESPRGLIRALLLRGTGDPKQLGGT